jgi:class 3 adenylate cyclase/CHASE2 domain-containing sensor protein
MGPLRRHAAASLIVLLAALAVASPVFDGLNGLSIDVLTMIRWRIFGDAPVSSTAIVVALDEETFRTPPFEGTPSVTWTREIGRVLTAILDGGAKVVGFDVVFPTSIEQSEVPFGEETLGARVRGFDRDYLRALALGARAGKVVLGQVQHQEHPVLPSPGQRAAVGFGRNIRALNVHIDSDDVIRRLPLTFMVDGEPVPSMAAELATRYSGAPPSAKMATAGAVPNAITLNFAGGADDIPTFSLADLRACVEKDDKDFFRRHFDGKIVLFGTLLDVEDRKITSKRFATAPEGARAERCALPIAAAGEGFRRDSISGVYIHATAINNVLRGDPLTELGRIGIFVSSFVLAGLAAAAALTFGPAAAAFAFLGIATAWIASATVAFQGALVLPLVGPLLAALAALGTTFSYRFVVADRSRRLLRQSFALYLAPAVIEKMLASNQAPVLGGELRVVTVYFSDMADFSAMSEQIAPAELVAAMNEYLSAMTDIIEAHGGFVDKYIGDAVVAVFGAPHDDPNHATNAVRAALQCAARLPELERVAAAFQGRTVRQRIGLNSGETLVGNIGSRRRFNYTVLGDTVNLASRLEGANRFYATTIMASEATKILTGATFAWREIDTIRVKGRVDSSNVFEPLGASDAINPEKADHAKAYADGLARFRARDFAGAAEAFAISAKDDPPAALFLARAKEFSRFPPGPDWKPINMLEEK